jgi:hypothetical protein
MVRSPVVSSIRSRQTGQVGSSTSEGVGGARGFVVSDEAREGGSMEGDTLEPAGRGAVGSFMGAGVKGSLVRSG